jgi:hypothetical protein
MAVREGVNSDSGYRAPSSSLVRVISPDRAASIRPFESASARGRFRTSRACVPALTGLLLLASLALSLDASRAPLDSQLTEAVDLSTAPASPAATDRYAILWPFSRDSIWNLPIGDGARYVPANITRARDWGMTVDQDVIILTPDAPRTTFFYNDDAWNGGSRCNVEGRALFEAPIPSDFVVPAARPGWTPNFATAILAGDNRTLIQGQPMARCSEGADPTIWWSQTREDLYGTGFSGGHGGSMLSSIGGTIRSGELVPGGSIPHAMKVNLDGYANLWYDRSTRGFRWPATAADGCASSCYRGKNPALRMGSLLALPDSIDIDSMGLETEPAKIVARAFQDYGGYVVDNTGWSVYALSTEYSPHNGWLEDEFELAWGFPIDPSGRDNPWSRDMDRIFLVLHVVDNWDAASWATVRASNGTLGAGGGVTRVAWAPDFSGAIPPPDLTPPRTWANLSGTPGTGDWYQSPVTVTLTASDDRSGVASMRIRVDGGPWAGYYEPRTITAEGRHTVEFYTTDIAGNDGPVESVEFGVDATGPPITVATLAGTVGGDGWYRTPVTVTLDASDPGSGIASIRVRTDGGNWTNYSAPFEVSTDGHHTVEYWATDLLGNSGTPESVDFLIDTQAPIVTHAITGTVGSAGWHVSPVSVSLGPVGATGSLTSISYAMDGVWQPYTGPFTVEEGRHIVSYQARYAHGNLGPVESIAIDVDHTAPTVAITTETTVLHPDATISWSGFDSGSGIAGYAISLDGAPFVDVGTATSVSGPWSPRSYVLVVRAIDAAGNHATTSFPFLVDVDAPRIDPPTTVPPAVQIHGAQDLIQVLIVVGTVAAGVAFLLRGPLSSHPGRRAAEGAAAPPSDASGKPLEGPAEPPQGPQEPSEGEGSDALKAPPTAEPTAEPPKEPTIPPSEEPPTPAPEVTPEEGAKGAPTIVGKDTWAPNPDDDSYRPTLFLTYQLERSTTFLNRNLPSLVASGEVRPLAGPEEPPTQPAGVHEETASPPPADPPPEPPGSPQSLSIEYLMEVPREA